MTLLSLGRQTLIKMVSQNNYLTIFDQTNHIEIAQSYCDIETYLITIAIKYHGESTLQYTCNLS
jgi:hypothetical protein